MTGSGMNETIGNPTEGPMGDHLKTPISGYPAYLTHVHNYITGLTIQISWLKVLLAMKTYFSVNNSNYMLHCTISFTIYVGKQPDA